MPKLWSWADSEDVERTLRRLGVDGLSGAAFEEFVGELFRLAGFDVETPGGAGDLGADLIVEAEGRRLTVQVKRYAEDASVSRRAVSDAVAARSHYDCSGALVVTNRTFSEQVREFAQGRCYLMDREYVGAWALEHEQALSPGTSRLDGLSGSEFETVVAEALRTRGYDVEEVGGSGDFGGDLIVSGDEERIVAQLKRHSEPVTRRAVSDAVAARGYFDCEEAWVVTTAPGFTRGARRLAESTEARLVGRGAVEEWLDSDAEAGVAEPEDTRTPRDVLADLEWADRALGVSVGNLELDVAHGQIVLMLSAMFLGRVKAVARLPYQNAPEESWLMIRLPNHELLRWEAPADRVRSVGSVFASPLQPGGGRIRLDLFASLPGGAGTQEGLSRIQTLIGRVFAEQMEGRITRGAPERSEMRALLED